MLKRRVVLPVARPLTATVREILSKKDSRIMFALVKFHEECRWRALGKPVGQDGKHLCPDCLDEMGCTCELYDPGARPECKHCGFTSCACEMTMEEYRMHLQYQREEMRGRLDYDTLTPIGELLAMMHVGTLQPQRDMVYTADAFSNHPWIRIRAGLVPFYHEPMWINPLTSPKEDRPSIWDIRD